MVAETTKQNRRNRHQGTDVPRSPNRCFKSTPFRINPVAYRIQSQAEKQNEKQNENQNQYDLVVFMGDTNIISKEQKVFDEIIPDDWKDYFIEFGSPKILEYTYDHTKNNNVRIPVKSRLDRLYFKNLSELLDPYSFAFLGQEPTRNNLFQSDHFGILATFELKNLL